MLENYGISDSLVERVRSALEMGLKTQIKKIVPNLHPADQAELFCSLNKDERAKLINILKNDLEPEFLLELKGALSSEVVNLLDRDILLNLLTRLDADDITYILEEIDDEVFTQEVLKGIKSNKKKEMLEESLSYPEDSVGRLMTPREYTAVPKDWTITEVIKYMQKNKSITGEFSEIVIVDEYFRPVSTVSAGQLLRNDLNKKMFEIMRDPEDLKIINASQDQSEAGILFTKYNLKSAPVVNDSGILVGMIYLSDILDVVQEEANEDMLLMGNVGDSDIRENVGRSALKRFPWLITTVLTTLITSFVVSSFTDTIQKVVELVTLLPVLAGLGGVSGTQTLTVLVRNLATKNINERNSFKIILKESLTGALNGLFLAIFGFLITLFWHKSLSLSIVFSFSVLSVLFLSCLIGSIVPLVLTKFKLDPAVTAGSFITTTVDVLSYTTFLFLAKVIIL